jgi:hypothetical protein
MQTGRKRKPNDRPQFRLKRGFGSLIVLFFGFILVFGQPSPSGKHHTVENNVYENLLHFSQPDYFFSSTQPPHFPFESAPVPWEPNSTDKEGETVDNLDDEQDKGFFRESLKRLIDTAATKRELSQQTLSSANDERVPLFVLHHSWKTFVS